MIDSATPETFSDVFERLERDGARYVVIGGVAVVLHGHVRPVADLDIVVSPVPEERSRALQSLIGAGFVASQPAPPDAGSELRVLDPTGQAVDVFAHYHVPFEDLWAASERKILGGDVVHVVSLEQLLRAKWATGRPHDVQDITALLALKSSRWVKAAPGSPAARVHAALTGSAARLALAGRARPRVRSREPVPAALGWPAR